MNQLLALDRQRVDLWLLALDEPRLIAWESRLLARLTPAERRRHDAIVVERARLEQRVTRVLVREVLSQYAPVRPDDWLFSEGAYGRPQLAGPVLAPLLEGLDFNISHTRGLVAVAISYRRVVGIDVEETGRARRTLAIADRFFAATETAALQALPPAQQPQRFVELWTLKEAYIKARGMGLRIPLGKFAFDLDAPPPIRVRFEPDLADDESLWQFELFAPSDEHLLALAIEGYAEPQVALHQRDALSILARAFDG